MTGFGEVGDAEGGEGVVGCLEGVFFDFGKVDDLEGVGVEGWVAAFEGWGEGFEVGEGLGLWV